MKRILKKGVAVVLALMCVMNFMVMIASAATVVASGTYEENKNLKWTVDSAGTLTISGSGAMAYRTNPGPKPWRDAVVKKIVVKEGVTHIGDYAFSNMYDLKEVSFPSSIRFVGEEVFYGSSYTPSKDSFGVYYEDNVLLYASDEKMTGTYKVKDGTKAIADSAFYNQKSLSGVVLPQSLASIGKYAFSACNLTSVTIPERVEYIGKSAFENCSSLKTVTIKNGVKSIGESAFKSCSSLKEIVVPQSVTEMGDGVFSFCDSLQKASIRGRVSEIGLNTFDDCNNLKVLELPSTLNYVGRRAVDCKSLTDVYYEGTEAQWNKITVKIDNEGLSNATKHYNHKFPQVSTPPATPSEEPTTEPEAPETPPVQNGYNRGEETYKFTNYMDFHFKGFSLEIGHCFGMAVTSSGYYVNLININEEIGISDSSKLYLEAKDDHEFFKTGANTHTDPICHYQSLQGSSFKNSIVAGGSWWLTKLTEKVDLAKDWDEVVAYIQDGSHNDKGDLIIVYKGDVSGQHAVNFLRCEGNGDNAKIYVYDNNFPEDDNIYFYKENGKVYCNYSSESPENIKSLSLCDVARYLENVNGVKMSNVVYSEKGDIKVTYVKDGSTEVTEEFPLVGCKDEVVLHEIEDNAEKVVIEPLVEDAQFVYMNNTYTVDEGETVELIPQESDEDISSMKVEGKKKSVTLEKKATMSIVPSVYVEENYAVSYVSSDAKIVSVDEKGTATAKGAGKATVTCTVKDENGNVIAEDTYEITVTGSSVNWTIVIIVAVAVLVVAAAVIVVTVIIISKRKKKG